MPGHEARLLFEAVDWAAHPLGPLDRWPISLTTMLRTLFASSESMYLVWGESQTFFFNDAYLPILGPRRDVAMGARFDELWVDAYAVVSPMFLKAMAGESVRVVDMPMRDGARRRAPGGRSPIPRSSTMTGRSRALFA